MNSPSLIGNQKILRIYILESIRFERHYLWRTVLEMARSQRLAGCTVLRGFAGFGLHHGFHSEMSFEGAGEFTMILEVVDSEAKTAEFLKSIEPMLSNIVVVLEDLIVRHYSHEPMPSAGHSKEVPMQQSSLFGTKTLLRIFIGESDKAGHLPLYSDIINQARKLKLAGATVVRGVAGFGASSVIHEPHLMRLSSDLPIVLEIIDSKPRIDSFLKLIQPLLKGALVTEEDIDVRHYEAN